MRPHQRQAMHPWQELNPHLLLEFCFRTNQTQTDGGALTIRPHRLYTRFPGSVAIAVRTGVVGKAGSTLRSSRAVPHPSTNRALRRLTSEVGRDPVHSTRYGRQRSRTMLSMQRAVLGGPFDRVANCWLDLVCLLVSKRYANTPVVQCAWNATVSMLSAARLSPPSRRLAGGFRQRRCLAPCVCV